MYIFEVGDDQIIFSCRNDEKPVKDDLLKSRVPIVPRGAMPGSRSIKTYTDVYSDMVHSDEDLRYQIQSFEDNLQRKPRARSAPPGSKLRRLFGQNSLKVVEQPSVVSIIS
jgi:hypothetical protein